MAPGSKIAISSLWLHNTLSSVSRNLEKRQKRAGGHIKKNPNKKRRIIDLDSETIKRLMDGFYDPWELQQHGGTKAFESDERFLALRGNELC